MDMRLIISLTFFLLMTALKEFKCEPPKSSQLVKVLLSKCNKSLRPVKTWNDKLQIEINFQLIRIIEINTEKKYLHAAFIFTQEWYDHELEWAPYAHDQITNVVLPEDKVWIPDIIIYNQKIPSPTPLKPAKVHVFSDGKVSSSVYTAVKVYCDTSDKFPFDNQVCVLKFASWTYDGLLLNLVPKEPKSKEPELSWVYKDVDDDDDQNNNLTNDQAGIDMSLYQNNSEWKLTSITSTKNEKFYYCCVEPYIDVIYFIYLKRISSNYIYSVIIPSILIVFLPIIAFLLPMNSNLKISYVAFILIILVADFSLKTSKYSESSFYPIIRKSFVFTMVNLVLTMCCSILVMNLNKRKDSVESKIVQKIMKGLAGYVFLDWSNEASPSTDDAGASTSEQAVIRNQKQSKEVANWQQASKILNRVFFVTFLMICVIGNLVMFFYNNC